MSEDTQGSKFLVYVPGISRNTAVNLKTGVFGVKGGCHLHLARLTPDQDAMSQLPAMEEEMIALKRSHERVLVYTEAAEIQSTPQALYMRLCQMADMVLEVDHDRGFFPSMTFTKIRGSIFRDYLTFIEHDVIDWMFKDTDLDHFVQRVGYQDAEMEKMNEYTPKRG